MATKTQSSISSRPTLFKLAVENLNIRKRSDTDRESMRRTLKGLIETALENAFPEAAKGCTCQNTEDGIEMVIPARIAKSELLSKFMPEFEVGIEEYNGRCTAATVCRLRAVFHFAEGNSIRDRFDIPARLLASSFLRLFFLALPKEKCVALLVSDEYYRQVVAPPQVAMSREFRRARIQTTEKIPLTVWAYHYPATDAP